MAITERRLRLRGVDGWRAVLVVMGVAMHAVTTPSGPAQWVGVVTHTFRMEAFFALSGMFAALSLERSGPSIWLRSRLSTLGIPLLGTTFLLNPMTVALNRWTTSQREGGVEEVFGHIHPIFLHCWFLWVLILCSIAAAWYIAAEDCSMPRVIKITRAAFESAVPVRWRWPATLLSLYLGLFSAAWLEQIIRVTLGAYPNGSILHKALVAAAASGTLSAPSYLIYFFLGFSIVRNDNMMRACLSSWPLYVSLVASGSGWLITSYLNYGDAVLPYVYSGGEFQPFFIWGNKVLIGLPATLLIIKHGLTAKSCPLMMTKLARASYTIFVCHLFLLAIVMHVLGPAFWGSLGYYLTLVVLATGGGYLVHYGLVERSTWAALILNGRISFRPLKIAQAHFPTQRPAQP